MLESMVLLQLGPVLMSVSPCSWSVWPPETMLTSLARAATKVQMVLGAYAVAEGRSGACSLCGLQKLC